MTIRTASAAAMTPIFGNAQDGQRSRQRSLRRIRPLTAGALQPTDIQEQTPAAAFAGATTIGSQLAHFVYAIVITFRESKRTRGKARMGFPPYAWGYQFGRMLRLVADGAYARS